MGKTPALIAACLALCLGGPLAAKDATVEVRCTVGHRKAPQYQPSKIQLTLNLDKLTATVSDDIMARSGIKAQPGRIDALNDKKITVSWQVNNPAYDKTPGGLQGKLHDVRQRLTILMDGRTFLISLAHVVGGHRAEVRADAACVMPE